MCPGVCGPEDSRIVGLALIMADSVTTEVDEEFVDLSALISPSRVLICAA